MKKIQIYKKDNWNMLHVEVQGRTIIVREISDQWGEDTFTFQSRPELMSWVQQHFAADRFEGSEEERQRIIEAFSNI